jgi:hypothetical protein
VWPGGELLPDPRKLAQGRVAQLERGGALPLREWTLRLDIGVECARAPSWGRP